MTTTKVAKPKFQPVSHGKCDILTCHNPATFRGSWYGGIVIKLVCTAHKAEVENNDIDSSKFGTTRDLTRANPLALLG